MLEHAQSSIIGYKINVQRMYVHMAVCCMYLQFQRYLSALRCQTKKEMTLKCIAIVGRMPEIKDIPMIECTKCRKWFHVDCEVIPKQALHYSQADLFVIVSSYCQCLIQQSY